MHSALQANAILVLIVLLSVCSAARPGPASSQAEPPQVVTTHPRLADWSATPAQNYPSKWCPPFASTSQCPLARTLVDEFLSLGTTHPAVEVTSNATAAKLDSSFALSPYQVSALAKAVDASQVRGQLCLLFEMNN